MPQLEVLPMLTQKMPRRMSPVTIQGPSAAAHASAKPATDSTIEAIEVGVRLCVEGKGVVGQGGLR